MKFITIILIVVSISFAQHFSMSIGLGTQFGIQPDSETNSRFDNDVKITTNDLSMRDFFNPSSFYNFSLIYNHVDNYNDNNNHFQLGLHYNTEQYKENDITKNSSEIITPFLGYVLYTSNDYLKGYYYGQLGISFNKYLKTFFANANKIEATSTSLMVAIGFVKYLNKYYGFDLAFEYYYGNADLTTSNDNLDDLKDLKLQFRAGFIFSFR